MRSNIVFDLCIGRNSPELLGEEGRGRSTYHSRGAWQRFSDVDGKSAFSVRGVASQTEGPERREDRGIVKGDGDQKPKIPHAPDVKS